MEYGDHLNCSRVPFLERAGGLRALDAVVALSLFTVGALDYPFEWGVRVRPETLELTLER